MYTIKYFDDNVYTGDISKISDIKYINIFDLNYDFSTGKSIISNDTDNSVNVCFYKNKGTTFFPFGEYKKKIIKFSDKTFYQDLDFNHSLNSILGYKSSFMLLGSFEASFVVVENCGIKISFSDVYNVVLSFWIYISNNVLYVKDNNNSILYSDNVEESVLVFGFYNNDLIVNSINILTVDSSFLPYNFFVYGDINDLNIVSNYFIPLVFEGTGSVIDDIYGDVYCITKPVSGLGYLKSKSDNVLTLCDSFAFDIAFRAVGNSIPFSVSNGATFSGSGFIMNNASVWVDFDTINNVFYSNILTTSGVLTISGAVSELNDYYLMRCYYRDNKFGTILNGIDTWTTCDNATISGGPLNILTYDTLIIDSFALYNENFPTQSSYDQSLSKLVTAVSSTALAKSHDINKVLFGIDNFYPKDFFYNGIGKSIGDVPVYFLELDYYKGYSLAGGEVKLNFNNFYVSRLPFKEDVYNCFICENDKTFLTYFSGITVPTNRIVTESFTNYGYVNDNFITTNSGLYIRNYLKIFDSISSVSIIEFLDIGWTNSLNVGVLFGAGAMPEYPNENCVVVTSSGISHIGTTTFSGLNISSNSSIYFYVDNSYITVSGSNTGVLCSGIVTNSYDYIRYFIRNTDMDFATINKIYISTATRKVDTLTNKFFSYELPKYYNLDNSYEELFYNIGSNVSSKGITVYDTNFYECDCSFSTYYDTTFSGMFNLFGYNFLGISDSFENGFITERWRLLCDPYGVYSCNQPGWVSFGSNPLVDAVDIYASSLTVDPEEGFVILCDIDYYDNGWITIVDDYVSPTLSGTDWPIRHIIPILPVRTNNIRVVPNGTWNDEISIVEHASCFYNYGGTASCTVDGITCLHVALDDVLYVYAEYNLKGSFELSLSGINCYPLNSKLELKDYFGNGCYIETEWTTSSGCNVIVTSESGIISTTVSGFSNSFVYSFCVSRDLDVINLSANIQSGENGNLYSSYSFSSDDLGLDLVFYNEDIPHIVGSGCLFEFKSDDYTVNFSSISAGYKFKALDGTDNISIAGASFNSYPPNLFVDKIKGDCIGQSHRFCTELTVSGFRLIADVIGDNIAIGVGTKSVGGVQQVSKFNRMGFFSDYMFVPTVLYRSYVIGKDRQYTSFSDISNIVQTGDKIYFYPGSYSISTDKQLTIIGVGNSIEIRLRISNASNGLTVMGCTTTELQGSGMFNMYNCYILSWEYWITYYTYIIVLYHLTNINFYNCNLYNYSKMGVSSSYVLLHKCTVYSSSFSSTTIYNEGYSTRGHYDYGPEFNRASFISGLSHIDNIIISDFYYNSVYNHFPLHNQLAIEKDSCKQLLSSTDTYSVYFYGDIKKLNSFSMYLFIQDLDGKIEIRNSSDFVFTVDSNNLNVGMHLVMNLYGSKIDMSVPISHSNVFKLAIIAVIFDGSSISIYLNGAKLDTRYIVVMAFNDPNSYLEDSVLFFDKTNFVCDGNGLLLKGANLTERIDFLVGTHIEERYADCFTEITINMEFTTYPVLTSYHNNGSVNYYGYSAHNTGVGLYCEESGYDYNYIYFNGEKSYKIKNNMASIYTGIYRYLKWTINGEVCTSDSTTTYITPCKTNSVSFTPAKIEGFQLGWCNISDPYGYIALDLTLPMPVIERSAYCFDTETSIVAFSFDLPDDPYVHDVGPNQFVCTYYRSIYPKYGRYTIRNGIFHNSIDYEGGDYCYISHNNVLNLNNNFTIECLFSFCKGGYLVTKGTASCNIAYRVAVNSRHIPYFVWSWEGDNVVYANRPILSSVATYLAVVIGVNTITFYINGKEAGINYTDKLTIIDNLEKLNVVSNYSSSGYTKNIVIEELCLSNGVKTKNEIENTWNKISGGDKEPWIKINSVTVVSSKPIKTSPSDRFIEVDNKIDMSKWEYVAYTKPSTDSSGGLILDSRQVKKIESKVISYNVIFDVSIFCEFLEYSTNRGWSITFRYKFSSGNYISVIVNYVEYDNIYVRCECYYNNYKDSTNNTKLILSPCGIRFITDYDGYTCVQIGSSNYWYTLWTSSQKLFVETCGHLEIILNNDAWDSWFVVKLTDFLPRLYCSSIPNGQSVDFYDAIPYGRSFYNQTLKNTTALTLNNDLFEIDSTLANIECIHSLEFINGQMSDLHVLNLNNRIFDNVNYEIFNIELLVYLTYDDTNVLNLFPWINIDVKNKYLYITMHDNDRTITDSISESLNNYVYIAVSLGNPHTILHINSQVFTYDTNFTDVLPYHFYPIGKSFSGQVVYFCGYHGDFDESGYEFRVSTLLRYIGFDNCGRKVFGNNMVTSLDSYSIIYVYNSPVYSALLTSTSCDIVDWVSGWSKRIKLTIPGFYIDEDLVDFPVMVHLDSTCLGVFNELGSNNRRMSIVTTNQNQCYVEIEDWDESTNNAWLWVKVPTLSSGVDSDLYLYYDNNHVDNLVYVSTVEETPAQNVWDSNFVGVWHMNQDPSGGSNCIKDSTSNTNHGTPNGSMTSADLVDGKVGKALNFSGDTYLTIPYDSVLDLDQYNSITIEGIIDVVAGNCYFIWTNQSNNSDFIFLYVTIDRGVWFRIYQQDSPYDQRSWHIVSSISVGWHYITAVHTNQKDPMIYVDSILMEIFLYEGSGDNIKHTTNDKNILIASNYSEDNFTVGKQEEIRVSNIARSVAWIKMTYYSNWNQLINYGNEEIISFGSSGGNNSLDVKILFDPAVLQSIISHVIVIKCDYSDLFGEKTTSITVTARQYNVSHNYYDSFGHIGESDLIFSYDLIGVCYNNLSIFYLNVDNDILERILKGTVVLNIKNNETKNITNIYMYLDGELSINEIYGSSLFV